METTIDNNGMLSHCYCINLRRAANRISDYYGRYLDPLGITINQFSILANVDIMSGCGTGQLAKQLHLEKSTLVRTLQPLLNQGLIEDTAPEGSRPRKLQLTAKGREILETARPLWKEAQAGIKSKLGNDEVRTLMQLLGTL